jgi:hypothetical protein
MLLVASLVLLAFAQEIPAQTVIILLKNGDRLTGTPVSQNNTNLILDTSIGRIPVPLDQIQSKEVKPPTPPAANLQSPAQPPPPPPAQAPPKPTPESTAQALDALSQQYRDGKITPAQYHQKRVELLETVAKTGVAPQAEAVATPPAPAPTAPAAAPGAAPAQPGGVAKTKGKSQWTGDIRVGVDQGFGTKDRQLVTGGMKVTHAWQHLRNTADYRVAYGKTDGELSANRMDGALKSDWQVKKRFYVYNLGGAGYDEIRRIDVRYEEGPGLGTELSRWKNLGLSAELGMNYYVEMQDRFKTHEHFYYRLAETLTWKLTTRIQFDEKFEWFPRAEEPEHYRIRFESNLHYLLGSNMSLVLTVLDQYDTDPAANVDRNDLQIQSSLGMKF